MHDGTYCSICWTLIFALHFGKQLVQHSEYNKNINIEQSAKCWPHYVAEYILISERFLDTAHVKFGWADLSDRVFLEGKKSSEMDFESLGQKTERRKRIEKYNMKRI